MRKLEAWRRLNRCERKLLLEALVALTKARLSLWLRPFSAAWRDSHSRTDKRLQKGADAERIEPTLVARAVQRASTMVPAATCLAQALATQSMLDRRGIAAEVRIGVARDEHRAFEAHAWVELGGRVLIGHVNDLDRFKPFPRFSQRGG